MSRGFAALIPGRCVLWKVGLDMRYHIMWSTYGSWLPGDPRGFRTRHHRQHVEGDYKSPPPAGKYDGLHDHAKRSLNKPPVVIPRNLRETVGLAILERFATEDVGVSAVSVGGQHVHVAVDCLPHGLKQMIGRVKKVASHRIRDRIPGKVWGAGCDPVAVKDQEHWGNVLVYIRDHAHLHNAWVWMEE